jgi:oxepin-CoA hydrolase/3-oxo-5,6-dehydrosuberyl-CoA semialdehyde dehydrogenase
MPVITKPATATALVAHRLMQLFESLVPPGVLQMLVGPAGSLLEHVQPGDVVAFTGGSATASKLRAQLGEKAVRLNVEADSLNAAVLGPDVDLSSETGALFGMDVVRDMTQKTGQKCTAIRRVLVPTEKMKEVSDVLRERLAAIVVGDPAREEVKMGPLATAQQLADVKAGLAELSAATQDIFTGHVTETKGYFVGPALRAASTGMAAAVLHEREIFGPVATLVPYGGEPSAAADFIARAGGCLVSSAYSDDREWVGRIVAAAAPWLGRLYLGSSKMASQSPGPGTALPSLVHGGPGHAGGGEELGGERGMHLYMQRVALEGDASVLKSLVG